MAKVTGLGQTTLTIQDDILSAKDMRGDTNSWDFSTPFNMQETTGVDKYAVERLPLLADYTGTFNAIFNPSANQVHDVMSGNLRVARETVMTMSAQTITATVLFTAYDVNRAAGGELTAKCPFALSNGIAPIWT